MTATTKSSDNHFTVHYFQQGWADGDSGKVYGPPRYNQQDRAAYRQGFDEARELNQSRRS